MKSTKSSKRRTAIRNTSRDYTISVPSRRAIARYDGDAVALLSAMRTTFFLTAEHASKLLDAGRIPDTVSEHAAKARAEKANLHYEALAVRGRSWRPFRAIPVD